ncbi:MAG: DUF1016 N-terminal domain-containing protein, partial [Bacteroidota bacterium]|nr:DUF1016 N-terminal domain-containing protein [Bacteroidota bacterium]
MREQLSWTHIRIILSIKEEIKREFYLQLCIKERWKTGIWMKELEVCYLKGLH